MTKFKVDGRLGGYSYLKLRFTIFVSGLRAMNRQAEFGANDLLY